MFDQAYTWVISFQFTNLVGFLLFWVPLSFCAVGFFLKSIADYYKDRAERQADDERLAKGQERTFYQPKLYVGTIVARIAASVIPVVNIWAALFHVSPYVFGNFFRYLEKALQIPLVPKRN